MPRQRKSTDVCEGDKPTKKPAITTNTEQVHVDTPPKIVPAKRSLPPHEASKKPALSERVVQPHKKVPVTLSSRSCLKRLWHSDKEDFNGWFEENNDDINVFVTRLDSTLTVQTTTHLSRASRVHPPCHVARGQYYFHNWKW